MHRLLLQHAGSVSFKYLNTTEIKVPSGRLIKLFVLKMEKKNHSFVGNLFGAQRKAQGVFIHN